MKNAMKAMLVLALFVFAFTQCDKTPSEPEAEQSVGQEEVLAVYAEAEVIGVEIDAIEDSAFTDSTEFLERRARRALRRLTFMLNQVGPVVMWYGDEEAKALIQLAREAQHDAVEAIEAGDYEGAFEYIQESAFYAMEAMKLVREDIEEQKEQIIQRLQQGIENTQGLLDDVRAALEGEENEKAERLYNRATSHLGLAQEALEIERLRRAGYHLRMANRLAHMALHVLDHSDAPL